MKPLRVMSVVGARPNFMKIAPFARAIDAYNGGVAERPTACREAGSSPRIDHFLVHTGQHYDAEMSHSFFKSLDIPEPDIDLGIGSGTHAEQVGRTMIAFEKVVREWRPDWVVVLGDVNATCACAITARKERVRLAHIEAGLRSFDMTMPEEINRLVTDRLSNLLFSPDAFADQNLRKEGVPDHAIKRVGNIMIDTLEANRDAAARLDLGAILAGGPRAPSGSGPRPGDPFAVLTLHRPSNVDEPDTLGRLVRFFIEELSGRIPLVWTIHPRTRERLRQFGLQEPVLACRGILLLDPLGYREMLKLNIESALMLTDSGGLQEECCVLGTPCITLRENTERPVTLAQHAGVSILTGNNVDRIREAVQKVMSTGTAGAKIGHRPLLWDGHTAERIVGMLVSCRDQVEQEGRQYR